MLGSPMIPQHYTAGAYAANTQYSPYEMPQMQPQLCEFFPQRIFVGSLPINVRIFSDFNVISTFFRRMKTTYGKRSVDSA